MENVMLRILWCRLGLGFATLAIVLVTLFVPILSPLVIWHDPKGLLAVFLVGGLLTGLVVLPSFAFAAYVRSYKSITTPYYWMGVGGVTAFIANLFLGIIFIPYTNFIILNSSIIGGIAGGLVYSLFDSKETIFLMGRDFKFGIARIYAKFHAAGLKPKLGYVAA
jgi:hypothetical protein